MVNVRSADAEIRNRPLFDSLSRSSYRLSLIGRGRRQPSRRVRVQVPSSPRYPIQEKRGPLLSALKVLTGAQRRILFFFSHTGEARNPRWVSHPNLLSIGCLLLSLSLCACAPVAPAAPRPVMVEVPIATPIYCQVPKLQPPILAIAALTPDSPPADTVRSYAASVDVLKSAVHERDTILEACAPPTSAIAPPPTTTPQAGTAASPPEPQALSKDDSKAAPDIQSRLVSTLCEIISWPNYLFATEKQIK
jgi:hypothetical protein